TPDLAAGGHEQALAQLGERRLAGPVRTDNGEELALPRRQINAIERRPLALAIRVVDRAGLDHQPRARVRGSRRNRFVNPDALVLQQRNGLLRGEWQFVSVPQAPEEGRQ